MSGAPTRRSRRPAGWAWPARAAAVVVAVVVAGCGSSAGGTAGPPSPATDGAPATTAGPSGGSSHPLCRSPGAIAELPLRARLGQLVMVGLEPSRLQAGDARALVDREGIGGVFVARGDAAAIGALDLDTLTTAEGIPLMVSADQEGGGVQKITGTPTLPWPRVQAQSPPAQVTADAEAQGRALREAGITVDLAPVVDVSSQTTEVPIGRRSYGADADSVVASAGAFADGLRQAGVLPVYKHFPGHGRAQGDSHTGAATAPPLDQLQSVDLVPYRELLPDGPAAVMLGHLDVPGLTAPGEPASVSPAVVQLLRRDLGFDGLVMADDLSGMEAIASRLGLREAVRRFLAAGGDMALWAGTAEGSRTAEVLDHLEASVADGSLPEARVDEAVGRVLAAKRFTAGVTC